MDADTLKQKIEDLQSSSKGLRVQYEQAFAEHMAKRPSGSNRSDWAANFYNQAKQNFPNYFAVQKNINDLKNKITKIEKKQQTQSRKNAIFPLKKALEENDYLINNAHKIRDIPFKSLPLDVFNRASQTNQDNPAFSLYKSPNYNRRQSSEYKLIIVDGKPAYARKSNHWGTFSTNIKDVDEAVKHLGISREEAEERQINDPFGRIGSRYHNWSLIDGDENKNTSQAGYIHLDDLDPESIQKADGGGITAYHGSPYEFEQFDTSKIGTGEGAQAYGHGLYFAEAEPIAQGYRDRLTDTKSTYQVGNYDMPKWVLRKIEESPDRADMINVLRNEFNNRIQENIKEKETSPQPWLSDQRISYAKDILAGLEHIEKGAQVPHTKGRMYEVHIDAHPDHFLDWDKPLNDQPHVMNAIDQHIGDPVSVLEHLIGHQNGTGQDFYNAIGGNHKAMAVSQKLHEMGIQGIKYLDGSSRSQGEGTRNYVVFDHDRVKIKRRYAEGGEVKEETIDLPHSLSELKDWKKTHPLRRDPNVIFTRKESIIEGEPPIAMPDNLAEAQVFSKKRAEGGEVDEYPLARTGEDHLTEMAPDEFLNRARPLRDTKETRETVKDFKKEIKEGHKLDPLALYPHNRENGRHRATAAKELGIKKVPVHDYRKRDGGAIVKRALMIISKKA